MRGASVVSGGGPARRTGLGFGASAGTLLGLFALDNLLLLHFLGAPALLVGALSVAACGIIYALCRNLSAAIPSVPYSTGAWTIAIAIIVLALGGEGRLFYANVDWQVRDAVLQDMAGHPWPFTYDIAGKSFFLRAPLGMYLLPALFGPGAPADFALLLSNAVRLSLLLTLAWQLFDSSAKRLMALGVFLVFSGWDIVGTVLYSALGQHPSWDHLERWNFGFQYSSHITQAFWVPQHALAGWVCAVTFLLWRKGQAPIGLFAATIPLVAVWSPLAIIGAVPFALWAGIDVLRRRAFTACDVKLAALALGVALPALLYLQVDAASVGGGIRKAYPSVFLFCALLEVLPFAWPLLRKHEGDLDRPILLLTVALLLVMPFWQIGISSDFQMRASIMPLALLALSFSAWISGLLERQQPPLNGLAYAALALALGAATPLFELRRALTSGPSPRPLCSLVGVWRQQDNIVAPMSTYLAPVEALPVELRTASAIDSSKDPAHCWSFPWVTIRSGEAHELGGESSTAPTEQY